MRKILSLTAAIVLLDQATKVAVRGFSLFGLDYQGMMLYESRELFGDAVRITFVENPGMAFGLNFDMPLVLSLFSLAASIFLLRILWKTRNDGMTGLRLALALILAGAVGNLIDRSFYGVAYGYASLFHGRVVDFIDVDLPDISVFGREIKRFWVFNVADSAVSIGVVLLFFFYPGKESAQQPPEAPPPTESEETGVGGRAEKGEGVNEAITQSEAEKGEGAKERIEREGGV